MVFVLIFCSTAGDTNLDTAVKDSLRQVVEQSIEIIKDQVKIQQWKLGEEAERAVEGKKPTPQAALRAVRGRR